MKIYTGSFLEPEFNNHMKEVWGIENFDIIVQNPPYNPNSLWKKFIEKAIDLLTDDGYMLAIHPTIWRESSIHKKLHDHLMSNITIFHSCDAEIWKEQRVAIKIDWYKYNKRGNNNKIKCYYSNGNTEIINTSKISNLLRFSTTSVEYSILQKITKQYDNNIIILKGWDEYKNKQNINGKYKQCGGVGNGTGWVNGNYTLTNNPTEHQFNNKIVIKYCGKPDAKFFKSTDNIGVLKAYYWLTDNIKSNPESIVMLLNSKMFLKIVEKIFFPDKGMFRYGGLQSIPVWLLRTLNIENCYFNNIDEMYKHYNLTEEEINCINS
jgi:hypothetical protein